jgi:hypothetical protein
VASPKNTNNWEALSNRVDRTYHRDKTAGEVRLKLPNRPQAPIERPKSSQGTQTPLTPVASPEVPLWTATEASTHRAALLAEWQTVCNRLRKADAWFAGNDETADPQRYRNNEDRYCELMAESVRLAGLMATAGITCKEAAL